VLMSLMDDPEPSPFRIDGSRRRAANAKDGPR
jgi:hypothetical protein